jgi:hypothetical protein
MIDWEVKQKGYDNRRWDVYTYSNPKTKCLYRVQDIYSSGISWAIWADGCGIDGPVDYDEHPMAMGNALTIESAKERAIQAHELMFKFIQEDERWRNDCKARGQKGR